MLLLHDRFLDAHVQAHVGAGVHVCGRHDLAEPSEYCRAAHLLRQSVFAKSHE